MDHHTVASRALDDRSLVAAYQHHRQQRPHDIASSAERQAASHLLARLEPLLQTIARRMAQRGSDVEDLLQDARIEALEAAWQWRVDGGSAPTTWITRCVMRVIGYRAQDRVRLDRGKVQLVQIDTEFPDTPLCPDQQITAPTIVEYVHSACIDFDDDLSRTLVTAASQVANGISDHLGDRNSRSVAVRSVLAHPALGLRLLLTQQRGWWDDAACLGMPLRSYFPRSGEAIEPGIVTRCGACPVRSSCLSEALETGLRTGYRAGLSANARRQRVATVSDRSA